MSDKKEHQVKLNLSALDMARLATIQEREGLARPAHAAIYAIERVADGLLREPMDTILTRLDRRSEEAHTWLKMLADREGLKSNDQ